MSAVRQNIKANTFIYAGLFCIAFLVCLESCLNPFGLSMIDADTSVYLTITQGITRGQVPFRDFFDSKGPLIYLISTPGFALGRFTGVWITELVFVCTSVYFAYKTALFFSSRFLAFAGTALGFVIFQSFFYDVAGPEEYSLPFMMISLYIFTKHYFSAKNISFPELLILGFSFASSMLLKINLFPLWLGFCLVMFVEAMLKRNFAELGKYIAGFCAGTGIITIPVLLYLKINGAFSDYIYQNFIDASLRGLSGLTFMSLMQSFIIMMSKNFCFTPLWAAYIWIVKDFTGKKRAYYIAYILSFLLTVLFHAARRSNFDHYNMFLVPFLIPAFAFFVKDIYAYFSNIKYARLCFALFLCVLVSIQLAYGFFDLYRSISDRSRNDLILTGKTIDEQTAQGDTVIFLGHPAHIYLFTQRDAASKYIYQTSGIDYNLKAQKEFLLDLYAAVPSIIVLKNRNGRYNYLPEWYAPVYDMIENNYQMISDKNGYFLFKLKAGPESMPL